MKKKKLSFIARVFLENMASILRSGKILRHFAGLTRNFFINTTHESDNGLLLRNQVYTYNHKAQGFASTASAAQSSEVDLDKQLRRLDQDVRRFGRISRRDIEEILEEIRMHRSATSSQSLMVIRCCGNLVPEEMPEVRTALVQEIWKTLNALNVPMDISHYNALLRVYLENEHPFNPTDILAEIESKSLDCNRVTYQRLIARYCQQGDIDGATRILEHMREKKLPVNESIFNSLIMGHSQANDMESAKGILDMMKKGGLEPTADTYIALACCYAKHGDMNALHATLEECEKNDIVLLDKDLLEVIYSLAVNGYSENIDSIISKLKVNTGFNQDAVNIILRLVNKGFEDAALQILKKMPRGVRADGQPIDVGSFFIRQLVKAKRPVDKVLSICKLMQNEGLNPKALLIATETGLSNGLVNHTLPLLREMKIAGLPIRQHYFWPIICSVESNRIVDVIRNMQEEFSLNPTSETIREYVIPNMKEKNWERIISTLRDVGISSGVAASSAAAAALSAFNIQDAAKIMEAYRAFYPLSLFRQALIAALANTDDVTSFARIVRQIYESNENRQNAASAVNQQQQSNETDVDESSENATISTTDIVGSVLIDVISYFKKERVSMLERILTELANQGIPISSAYALKISETLGSEMTSQISELLGKTSSGELKLVPKEKTRKRGLDELTIEELEKFIVNVEAKGDSATNLKRTLLNACFRSKNLEKTLRTIEKLEAEKFTISAGVWSQLIDLYAHHGKVSEAQSVYEKLRSTDASFKLDNLKTIRLVDLLLKEDRLDDAIKFLDENKKSEPYAEGEGAFNYMTTIWRILNSLAESGDALKLQKVFDALIAGNYIAPTNVILGPLIRVHLVKDDISAALDTFEKICKQYNATPWKNDLACRLIQKEDAVNLQRLTDLSTNVHGEVNSLYDLVFAFVECGRIRQARKILETPGLRTRPYRIESACERYKNEGLIEPLEALMEATKDLNHIDRNKICHNLLLSYCKTNDVDKALGLWTRMQDENIVPTDSFLLKLGEFLKSKGVAVPFVIPNVHEESARSKKTKSISTTPVTTTTMTTTEISSPPAKSVKKEPSKISLMRKAIKHGKIDEAIELKNQLEFSEKASTTDVSRIVELLVRGGRFTEATKYVDEMLNDNRYPQAKIFKFYLNKIAASGDIETIKQLGEKISNEQKRIISYDNRLCHAYITAGKINQYLNQLKEEISFAKTPEDAAILAAKFPRGGALGILEKHPEKIPQFEEIAKMYADHSQLGPINVLWMHLITNGKTEDSKAIWDKYLSSAPRLMFQRVLQTARNQNDDKLAENIINQLRGSKITEGAIGNAYSCLIDIHLSKSKPEKALETLKIALKDVCLENINRTALLRLRAKLEEEKMEFPYSIPEKKSKKDQSSSSSSYSSDDDVTPNQPPETRPKKPSAEK